MEQDTLPVEESITSDPIVQLGTAVGNLAGLYFAFKHKTGFWKGTGYFLLGGLAGSLTGYIVSKAIPKKDK